MGTGNALEKFEEPFVHELVQFDGEPIRLTPEQFNGLREATSDPETRFVELQFGKKVRVINVSSIKEFYKYPLLAEENVIGPGA